MKRLLAIGVIWVGCSVAWMILGSTVVARSGESSASLNHEVQLLWGPPHRQSPPRPVWRSQDKVLHKTTTYTPEGKPIQQEVEQLVVVDHPLALDKSDVAVRLELEQRQKGLLWFPTYTVDFVGAYGYANTSGATRTISVEMPLLADAIYDGFAVVRSDGTTIPTEIEGGFSRFSEDVPAGERREFVVRFRSRGIESWRYELTEGVSQRMVRNFRLMIDTSFVGVDFPAGTLSPTRHHIQDGHWHGEWTFASLVAHAPIGIDLPRRVNPGPLAARITFFAPVGLLFFFFVIANFAVVRRRELHPLNYFFFGVAFFSFHLLFSYLVDHISVMAAFATAAQVSVLLVVTYARFFVGWRFALREMALAQLIYLVLFSFSFLWQGFTGLSITVGAVLTLAVMMQVTAQDEQRKRLQSLPTTLESRTP